MNIESVLKSPDEIQGTIINVSFPRSGHRYLREILSGYFEDRFLFYESYAEKLTGQPGHHREITNINYVKTHDFRLAGREALLINFPKNRRYLVQIRHPLESIASYYEFSLIHGHIRNDTEVVWRVFLAENLKYWKRFCDIWLFKMQPDSLLINYDDLCANTYKSAERAIKFLTGQNSLDSRRLITVIEDQVFLQYVGNTKSKKQHKRQLESFKYFSADKFLRIECALAEKYLHPNGIKLLF